jgi:hypothetical protein
MTVTAFYRIARSWQFIAAGAVLVLAILGIAVRVFLFLGPALEDGRFLEGLLWEGPAHSGWSAEWAGDLDGDGRPEILICTPFEPLGSSSGLGRARVFSGANGDCLQSIDGISERAPHYRLAMGGGDLDGDGRGDLLISKDGLTIALSGRSGKRLHSVADDWGYDFAPAGDIDHDGCVDWLCGTPLDGDRSPGRDGHKGDAAGLVRLISGRTGSTIHEFRGKPGDVLGWSVCGLGDTNGDGRDDFAVSTNGDDFDRHVAIVYSGADLKPLRELVFPPGQYRDRVAAAGDVDADGFQDILVGSHGLDSDGIVLVYSGRDGKILREIRHPVPRFGDLFDGAGDVDADGHADIIAGSWDETIVVSGRTGELLFDLHDACMGFGRGDLDGDGHADILITRNIVLTKGDPIDAAWDRGRLEVISGRDGSVLRTITGSDVRGLQHP